MNDQETMNYNLGLLTKFTYENFWMKVDRKNTTAKELKEKYKEFLKENAQAVNESVTERFGELIEEGAAEMRKKRAERAASGEDVYGNGGDSGNGENAASGGRKIKRQTIEDEILDDDDDEGEVKSVEDIDRKNTGKKVIVKKTVYDDDYENRSHDVIRVENIENGFATQNLRDIHYYVAASYKDIISGETEWKNTDEYLPISILDTSKVTEFDAVFAFMDLPNVDLSEWDVRKGKNFDGMFYKSSFNNDSIKYWELLSAENIRNMFVGSDMDKWDAIQAWEGTIALNYLPDLGRMSADDSEIARKKIRKMVGSKGDLIGKMRKRKAERLGSALDVASRQYVLGTDEYIGEKFGDGVKKLAGKLKDLTITLKNGLKFVIDKGMEFFGANSPENIATFVSDKKVRGAYVGVGEPVSYPEKDGYYDVLKKGDAEYDNYPKFLEYIKKAGAANESLSVNERKVGLRSKDSEQGQTYVNIDAVDYNTQELLSDLRSKLGRIRKKGRSTGEPLLVWGAPGIGKTTIPKTIITEVNKEIVKSGKGDEDKMSMIVVDCSILQAGDLSMPMPVKGTTIENAIKSNPGVLKTMKEFGVSEEDLAGVVIEKSSDAPKTWLPMYRPTGDPKKDRVLNAIANGAVNPVYDDEGFIKEYETTGGGGILMFDEFLRADPDTLFGIVQIMMNRSTSGGYVLGNKWYVMACSNRPTDDQQVANNWESAPPALRDRVSQVNFVPSFDEWAKWAKDKGGFDDFTIDFIGKYESSGYNNPKSRWHNIDPTEGQVNSKTRNVTPRTWSRCIAELNEECEMAGVDSYDKLGAKKFEKIVKKFLPDDISETYVKNYIMNGGGKYFKYSVEAVLDNPDMKFDGSVNATAVTENWMVYIRKNYGMDNQIPMDVLKKLVGFLEKNFKANGNMITAFIAKVYKSTDRLSDGQSTEESDKFWEECDAKYKDYDIDTLYDTVA